MLFLANAFSISMVPPCPKCGKISEMIHISEIGEEEVKTKLSRGFTSAVGHPSTADVLSRRLGIEILPERREVKLSEGDSLIIAQLQGGRLPEGKVLEEDEVSKLPIRFYLVYTVPHYCFGYHLWEELSI